MSGLDIYEDGFPHSTKEGYVRGCKGGSCPGIVDYGFSCRQAEVRYHGDYAFAKLVDAGKTPAEIVEIERAALPAPAPKKAPAKRKLTASGDTPVTPSITVADSVEPIPAPEPAPPALTPEDTVIGKNGHPIPLEVHGTTTGYHRGCREKACPGLRGEHQQTCRQAMSKYQVDYARRRKAVREGASEVAEGPDVPDHSDGDQRAAEDEQPDVQDVRPLERSTEADAERQEAETAEEQVRPWVLEPHGADGIGRGVRAEGLLSDLADAREQLAIAEAELAVYRRDPASNEQVVMTLSFIKGRLSAVKVS